jgi:hypothetical protein
MSVRVRWLVRGLMFAVVLALIVGRLAHRTRSSGYILKTVTTECNSDLRGDDAAVGDLVLHVRNGGQLSINYDVIPDFTALNIRLADIYKSRQERVFRDEDCDREYESRTYKTRQLCELQELDIRRRVLFVDIDAQTPLQTAAEAMSIAVLAVPNVKLVVLTPETRSRCDEKWASVPPGA